MEQEPIKATSDKLLGSVKEYLSPHDMQRLEAYVDNLADFHLVRSQMMDTNIIIFYLLVLTSLMRSHLMLLTFVFYFVRQILDLVPTLTHLYFQEKLPVRLSHVQACVLLCIGLQNQNISYIEVCLPTYIFN